MGEKENVQQIGGSSEVRTKARNFLTATKGFVPHSKRLRMALAKEMPQARHSHCRNPQKYGSILKLRTKRPAIRQFEAEISPNHYLNDIRKTSKARLY